MLKLSAATILKADKRRISFIASHQKVDRDSEVVLIDGIDTSEFERNPILCLQHRSQETAVARVENLRRTTVDGVQALIGEAVFPDRPVSNEVLADVKAGLLNAVSIGFRVLERGAPMLPGQEGATFTKTLLLEISLVSLPACPTCLVTAKGATKSCACGGAALEISDNRFLEIADPAPTHLNLAEEFVFTDDTKTLNRAIAQAVADEIANVVTQSIDHTVRDTIDYMRGRVR